MHLYYSVMPSRQILLLLLLEAQQFDSFKRLPSSCRPPNLLDQMRQGRLWVSSPAFLKIGV